VVTQLDRGEEVQAEAGAMLYMAGDVQMDTSMRGGLLGGLILQTLPFSRLAGRILGLTHEGTGGTAGVGGTIRDITKILGGD
jgi:hypothetical protein